MIRISKQEREALERVGLLKYKLQPSRKHPSQDTNFVVLNVHHSGHSKHIMITETTDILIYLGRWDMVSCLQKIRPDQLEQLNLSEDQIQHRGEYKPEAVAFVAYDETIRVYKTAEIMKKLGIWK